MTIFVVEWVGCECGGVEKVAFDSRSKAQAWIDAQPADGVTEGRGIVEVEVQ